jgi:hypothetical protein
MCPQALCHSGSLLRVSRVRGDSNEGPQGDSQISSNAVKSVSYMS